MKKNIFRDILSSMVVMSMFALVLFPALEPMLTLADDTGASAPGTMENIAGTGTDWSDVDNAKIDDSNYATLTLPAFSSTGDSLRATNFGFAIPAGSTIDGIVVSIKKKSGGTDDINSTQTNLVSNGSTVGSTKNFVNGWPTVEAIENLGGNTDVWGSTLTVDDINDSTFGVQIGGMYTTSMGATAYVNWIGVTVYYTTPAGISEQIVVKQQVTSEMSLAVTASTITMLPSIPGLTGGVGTGTTTITAITNNATGYTVALSSDNQGRMMGDTAGDEIPAYVPKSSGVPETWSVADNTAGFGYTIEADAGDVVSGSIFESLADGTNYIDAATSQDILKSATSTISTGAVSTIAFRAEIKADPSPSIASDWYVATTTLTMTMNP